MDKGEELGTEKCKLGKNVKTKGGKLIYMQHVKCYTVFVLRPLIWSEFPDSQREKGNKSTI